MTGFLGGMVAMAIGAVCVRLLDRERKLGGIETISFAMLVGMIVLGFSVLGCSLLFHDIEAGIIAAMVLCAMGLAWFHASVRVSFVDIVFKVKRGASDAMQDKFAFAFSCLGYAVLFALVTLIGVQAMRWDSQGFPQSSFMGWGDGAYHLDAVTYLATAKPFVLQEPLAVGAGFKYPFLVEFLSAILVRLHVPLEFAWHLPTMVGAVALVFAFWGLGKAVLSRKRFGFLLAFLVLCGSGLGFVWLSGQIARDAYTMGWSQAIVQNIEHPKFEYTHLDIRTGGKTASQQSTANIAWIVPVVSFFAHQRTFVLGGALGALFLYGWWLYRGTKQHWRWIALLGLMPLVHAHTFLALGIVVIVWFLFQRAWEHLGDPDERKEFIAAALVGGLVALPQVLYILYAPGADSHMFQPWFAWTMCTHGASWLLCDPGVAGIDTNALWFWFKNFGFIFIGWIAASFLVWRTRRDLRALIVASWVVFALANLVKFQPWEFDNNKVLFWWWVLAILLSLSLFAGKAKSQETRDTKHETKKGFLHPALVFSRLALVGFVILSSLAGAVDVWARVQYGFQILPNVTQFGYYGNDEQVIAGWIEKNTKPDDAFLTSSQPTQFIPMITGRGIYLGYHGWLWSHGYNALVNSRMATIREFLRTGDAAKLCAVGVTYWLIDNDFASEFSANKNANPAPWNSTQSVFSYQDGNRSWDIRKLNCR